MLTEDRRRETVALELLIMLKSVHRVRGDDLDELGKTLGAVAGRFGFRITPDEVMEAARECYNLGLFAARGERKDWLN